jgi:hypothetical protein
MPVYPGASLPAGNYRLTIPGAGEDAAATGDLDITDARGPLFIAGAGATATVIDGGQLDRVFDVLAGASLGLFGVTVQDGLVTGIPGIESATGGGIRNAGSLFISESTISGNVATSPFAPGSNSLGGGIYNTGNLVVSHCTISGNTATGLGAEGGGIWNGGGGQATITYSTVSGNVAAGFLSPDAIGVGGADGGGIFNDRVGSTLAISFSTVSGNAATSGGDSNGGGLADFGGGLTITACTIADNLVIGNNASGGGVYFFAPYSPPVAPATIVNSTIAQNACYGNPNPPNPRLDNGLSAQGGGIWDFGPMNVSSCTIAQNFTTGQGGGIYIGSFLNTSPQTYGPLFLHDTIVATNTAFTGQGDDVFGPTGWPISSGGYNLIGHTDGTTFGWLSTDLLNVDPMLGPLANNGGPTQTMALLPGSPAINAGDPAYLPPPSTDQRGFPRVVNGRIDIGAFEVQGPRIKHLVVFTGLPFELA